MSVADVAVPLFFVISGFLLAGHIGEVGWWKTAVSKRIRSLLVPYCLWNIAYLLLGMTLTSVAGSCGSSFGGGQWSELSVGRIVRALGLNPFASVQLPFLWFVRCLIVFVLVAPLFAGARRKWGWIYPVAGVAIGLILPYCLPPAESWETHFHKFTWVKGFIFYSLGVYLRWNGTQFAFLQSRKIGTLALVVGCGLFAAKTLFASCGDMIEAIALACVMLGVWNLTPDRPWSKALTSSAFPIFLLHSAVCIFFAAVFRVIGVKDIVAVSFALYLVRVVVTVVVCVGLTWGLRKVCSRFAALVFGGR